MANNKHLLGKIQPRFIEIIGPAGAGKTTLINSLIQSNQHIFKVSKPSFRSTRNIPFLVRNGYSLLPIFLRQRPNNSWFNGREVWWMMFLNEQHQILERQASGYSTLGLLDHGPVYMLTSLLNFGPEVTSSQVFQQWWARRLNQWTSYLDTIIWLDAPNSVLVKRIKNRETGHPVKGDSEVEMNIFLNRYRAAFKQVISIIQAQENNLELHQFSTDQETPDQIKEKTLDIVTRQ